MRLAELLPDAPSTWRGLDVTGVTADSRAVTPGALFFAFAGARADGMQFAAQALAAGAVAVVGEKSLPPELAGSPYIQVADARKSLSLAAAALVSPPAPKNRRRHRHVGQDVGRRFHPPDF